MTSDSQIIGAQGSTGASGAGARDANAHPPGWFEYLDPAIVRGYGWEDWIRYDTGKAVVGTDVAEAAGSILADESVA